MNLVALMPVGALIAGLIAACIGYRARQPALMLVGAALTIGPLSPLLKGLVSEGTQILFSVVAIAFALAGSIGGAVELRRQLRQR